MDCRHCSKMRMNVEGDRLSSLPDDLIHKILSSFKIRDVIAMSVLSPRWRFIWTSMPYLNLSIDDFCSVPKLSKFVTNAYSRRNNRAEVYSLKLRLRVKACHVFLKRILSYAFSHNIQQLDVVCLVENDNIDFPLSLFSSQSLKHLSLTSNRNGKKYGYDYFISLSSTMELPTLTTLNLHFVTLCDDNAEKCISIFLKCANLENLTLRNFKTKGTNGFSIVHPRLSSLTLENDSVHVKIAINVSAPQLKNLTIRSCDGDHVISAPNLVSLLYKGSYHLNLSTEGFLSLEKADICVTNPRGADAHQIFCQLQQLHNVKFLALNLEIVEILSSSVDLILQQPSPFVNLKSLNIYPAREVTHREMVTPMSTKLKSYLLNSSPGSMFTMVLREEIKAQKLMAELRVLLEKENDNFKTNRAHQHQEKTHVESHKPKKLKFEQNMVQMKSCLENLVLQFQRRKEKACYFISKLQGIEELLTKLPASKRAKIQPCFSTLCEAADIAISKVTDGMTIQYDENQTRLSLWFENELAT